MNWPFLTRMNERLITQIAHIASSTPPELVKAVLPKIYQWDNQILGLSKARILSNIINPQVKTDFNTLFEIWQQECPDLPGSAVAIALETGFEMYSQQLKTQVELAWTGPETNTIPLRRTDQALLQLINTAEHNLLIVSFAVYKIQSISEALYKAVYRGVDLNVILEHPVDSRGKIRFTGEQALGKEVLRHANLFVWPLEKRPLSEDGRHGSLHAKIALGDESTLFISSANLTDYAMNLNMEMGVLINGGDMPKQVSEHFHELIRQGFLQQIQ